jgi:hypothetical protein
MPDYRSLKFEDYKKAILSLLHTFSDEARHKLILAFEVCQDLEPADKRYRLEQSIDYCLWEIDEAVEMGFASWKNKHLVLRSEAIKYHEENSDECDDNCEVCKIAFGW